MEAGPAPSLEELARRLAECPPAYRDGLARRLAGLRRRAQAGKPHDRGRRGLWSDLAPVLAGREARQTAPLSPDFALDLPVIERRADIAEAIARNQVVVVCGETGSGKSTQLPKLCLELGRGIDGLIAHTQPRRIAARSLASRIAEETGTELGQGVGYKIRFSDRVGRSTRIKLVTDGMLLAETQGDPELAAYDTIIIDEAHERSLNIDFLLGYLKRLLPRRPDLKLIVTSATIDPERFSRHFDEAPIVNVSGRTYPVETRYRPLVTEDEDERDRGLQEGIVDGVDELCRAGPGDILVFLPGEREIRESAEALRKHHPPRTEILPLYGRLSAAEQQRVFAPHGQRRVVLATNVAETSLTVPGIRYVIDTGLARSSRYSYRTKVQRLPIEPISQASANQRAGRCGREAPGVCLRLYSEEDFAARPEFTDPEISRTNLAAVILQMKYLRLGAIETFPFVEPPDPRFVRDGLKLLHELQAIDADDALTELGRRLARLPVDPRIGRMLIAGDQERCLSEMLIIAAALSIQDPRERPMDARGAADEAHYEWRDPRSDFVALLRLWSAWRTQARHLSERKLRRWSREHFLSFARLREWRDTHRQLRELVKGMGFRENDAEAKPTALHRGLLTGLLSNVALRTAESEYTGPRGLKLRLFPGSGLAKRPPKWIVAAELVETSRVFARTVGEVRPEWIEPLAGHLVSRRIYDPFWEERKGRVAGFEDVTLYGLPLVNRRKINYARHEPREARRVFIREALVNGRFTSRGRFLRHNREVIAAVEALEAKSRRRDVLVDEQVLFDFYAERLPASVVDGPSFERWVKTDAHDRSLFVTRELLMERDAVEVTRDDYPDHLAVDGVRLPLVYHFELNHPEDGVTAVVPLAALNQLRPEAFEWLVPGLLQEKVATLIRSLPKALRKNFVPAPDFAAAVLDALEPRQGSLLEAMRRELTRMTGIEVPEDAWDGDALPAHLRMAFRVVDDAGEVVDRGRDLRALQVNLAEQARTQFGTSRDKGWEREGLRRWDFGELPEHVEFTQAGVSLRGYPAVVDEQNSVALKVLDSPQVAANEHRCGVRRLFMLAAGEQTKYLRRKLPDIDRLCLLYAPVGRCDDLKADILTAVFDRVFLEGQVPRDEASFRERLQRGRGALVEEATTLTQILRRVLEVHQTIRRRLEGSQPLGLMAAVQDVGEHVAILVYPGFVAETPRNRLTELPRYLEAVVYRLDRLQRDPQKDEAARRAIRGWWERYRQRLEQHRGKGIDDPNLARFGWLLEEYRVSLFAQELGTREKVSERRLQEAWEMIR